MMQSEERIRQCLRLVLALRAGPLGPDYDTILDAEITVLEWVLGEKEDPPSLDNVEEIEEAVMRLVP